MGSNLYDYLRRHLHRTAGLCSAGGASPQKSSRLAMMIDYSPVFAVTGTYASWAFDWLRKRMAKDNVINRIAAPNTDGSASLKASNALPRIGAMMRLKLSTEVDTPRMPPTSDRSTD